MGIEAKSIQKLLSGDRLSISRAITKIENRHPDLPKMIEAVFPHTGNAKIIGITGPPGAGKSTLVDGLLNQLKKRDSKVAVIAIDPSSPFSGGAVLGDRVRMRGHHENDNVFIRSLGTRGKQGGLSHATREVVMVLDAAGFEWIIIETAGIGQTELDVLKVAQSVGVILVPESGDSIQVMKAGLMEIADLFVVNKSDRPEADRLVKELHNMVALNPQGPEYWKIPVMKTEAHRSVGLDEVVGQFDAHQAFLRKGEGLTRKRTEFIRDEVRNILTEKLEVAFEEVLQSGKGQSQIEKCEQKEINPFETADRLIEVIPKD